jgi:hypothetical protein
MQQRLGPDHADTLATRFSIAQEMATRGEHSGAKHEFRDVLAVRQAVTCERLPSAQGEWSCRPANDRAD